MRIYIVSHKMVRFPKLSNLYMPLQVGTAINGKLQGDWSYDSEGDNISEKNGSFNELTGMYWIWKNSTEDIVGFCHYRRFFVTFAGKIENLFFGRKCNYLTKEDVERMLLKNDVIVHNRTYFKGSCRKQFKQTQKHPEDIDLLQQIISDKYPDYVDACKRVFNGSSSHLLNVLIARKKVFDDYCEWLFDILFSVESILYEKGETEFDRRMGMLGERLLDVWILKNELKVKECFMINTERTDWKLW